MIELIKKYLLKIVDDIDAGNSNLTESEAVELKVVESAINFWFKDDDYKSGGSKVYKYFREA